MTSPTSSVPRRRRIVIISVAVLAFIGLVVVGQVMLGSTNSSDSSGAAPAASASPTASTPSAENSSSASPRPAEQGERPQPPGGAATGDLRPHDNPLAKRDPDDAMAIGDVDADVVMIEWTDTRCPFCASFTRDTLPVLMKDYVDAGKLRIEIRDVSYFGDQSTEASIAARAAGRQGAYTAFLDTLYAAAPASGHPDLPREKLIGFAREAGVPDIAAFTADLDDPQLRDDVTEETGFAQKIGVSAVPFFVIGDTAMSGAQPVDTFHEYVGQAIEKAK